MIHLTHVVAGELCDIFIPERRSELVGFDRFLALGDAVLGFDTETLGLETYSYPKGTGVRLAQFGNRTEAWVLRADLFADVIARALRQQRAFTVHHAAFDLKVVDYHLGVTIEELTSRVFDTRIFAHLLDPRQPHEGGAGLRLKPLCTVYVDDNAADTQDGLNALFKTIRDPETGSFCTIKAGNGWRHVPIDNELYLLYAGLDVIYGRRLFDELAPTIKDLGLNSLSKFEHHFQGLVCTLERRGAAIDVGYTEELRETLREEAIRQSIEARRYGVENVNSNPQVVAALQAMGETLTEETDGGDLSVNKEVLMPLADLDRDWAPIESREPNPLAHAVLHAKRAGKWAESYADAFLRTRDANDRIHPHIGTLAARTARMSISNPPLQQLPSGDWRIRRAIVADPGQVIVAADYAQVEMRVLAGLCQDPTLVEAILSGTDLHDFTAAKVFGPDFTKGQRKVAKAIGFGKVYGGGASTVAKQTGLQPDDVRPAMASYDDTFPGIKRYGRKLMARAEYGKKEVVTLAGRHLPLDRDRLYAATNYVVQSTSRDLLAQAIVDIFDAGMGDHLLLPVHDELIAQAPKAEAEEFVQEMGRLMESMFFSIPITSEAEVYGKSWGHGYGCKTGKDGVCVVTEAHPRRTGVRHP